MFQVRVVPHQPMTVGEDFDCPTEPTKDATGISMVLQNGQVTRISRAAIEYVDITDSTVPPPVNPPAALIEGTLYFFSRGAQPLSAIKDPGNILTDPWLVIVGSVGPTRWQNTQWVSRMDLMTFS